MTTTAPRAPSQPDFWNGDAGQAWVEMQSTLDGMFQPMADLLLASVPAGPPLRVLDVGCGAGATTLAVARRIGPQGGSAVGVDVSQPLIEAARARAAREGVGAAEFILADAQRHRFAPPGFDLVISRFGVMFFDDPVQAFGHLRQATREGGRLRFMAWRSPQDNPFMTTAERAAAPLLPPLPPRRPHEPGQFAFADGQRVRGILQEAGWCDIAIEPLDVPCAFPEAALPTYLTRMGPLGRVLQGVDEARRAEVVRTVRGAFDPYVQGGEVRFMAACWDVSARR